MAELQSGQVMPLNAALSAHDSNGETLEFKAANEKDKNNNVWIAKGSDGRTYTVSGQPQVANVSIVKDVDENKIANINDPYYVRIEANRPKVGNPETTEEREKKATGKVAKREDVQQSQGFATTSKSEQQQQKK